MNQNTIKNVIRFFLGFVFIFSAVSKLVSISDFELYIYGLKFFSFDFTMWVARLIIAFEIVLGVLFLLQIYVRKVVRVSLVLLIGFSIFIGYLIFHGNQESCHCFGAYLPMSHTVSLVKNLFLIVAMLYLYNTKEVFIPDKKKLLIYSIVLSLIFPFAFSFPHTNFLKTKQTEYTGYDKVALTKFLQQNPQFSTGKQLICFFSPSCKYCEMAAKKVTVIKHRSHKDIPLHYIFFGSLKSIENFYRETHSPLDGYTIIPPSLFLEITQGKMPVMLLLDEGEVQQKYAYDDLDEAAIFHFFK